MMPSHGYILVSQDHHKMILPKLYNLYLNEELVDVVIKCEDAEMKAHSVVLAANSKFFERHLMEGRKDISVGVSGDHMGVLLQFMYLGRTTFEENDTPGVHAAAKLLDIPGFDEIQFDPVTEEHPLIKDEGDLVSLLERFEKETDINGTSDEYIFLEVPDDPPADLTENIVPIPEPIVENPPLADITAPITDPTVRDDEYLIQEDADGFYLFQDINNVTSGNESTLDGSDTESADESSGLKTPDLEQYL